MSIFIIAVIAVWIICGFICAGFSFAFFQGAYPAIAKEDYRSDRLKCFLISFLFGPIALLAYWLSGLFLGDKSFSYRWRLK